MIRFSIPLRISEIHIRQNSTGLVVHQKAGGQPMNRKYEYVKMIADCESISRAAEKLYVTPSTLSKYVQRLEEEIGLKLFDRIGKRFLLTYAGTRFLYWQSQLEIIEGNLNNELEELSQTFSGRIRVGVPLFAESLLISSVLPSFYKRYPNYRVEIIADYSQGIRKQMENNELDLALIPDYRISVSVEKHFLAEAYPVLVAQKSSPLFQGAILREGYPYPWVSYQQLKKEHFLIPFDNQYMSPFFENFTEKCSFKTHISAQAKSMSSLIKMVSNGLGITFALDKNAMLCQTDDLTLLSYGDENLSVQQIVLVCSKKRYLDEAGRYMMNIMTKAYQSAISGNYLHI